VYLRVLSISSVSFFLLMRICTDIVTLPLHTTLAGDTADDFPTTFHVPSKRSACRRLPAQPTGIAPHCFHLLVYIYCPIKTYMIRCSTMPWCCLVQRHYHVMRTVNETGLSHLRQLQVNTCYMSECVLLAV
jgi:hypothetical protein